MSSAPAMTVSSLAAQAYSDGYACHGDLDLDLKTFESGLWRVVEKHLGENAAPGVALRFANTLHTTDLYLTLGCSLPSERAWAQFIKAYQRYIDKVAWYVSHSVDAARELASDVVADLFMHDRSERSRIASFDARQSLATWLRVLISNRAINARMLKANNWEPIERLCDVADGIALTRMQSALRASKYQDILEDSFKIACESLTERERLILLCHYEDGLRLVEIGRVLDTHPSCITRQLHRTHLKLRKKIIYVLRDKHHLRPEAIKESLFDLLNDPRYSLLLFLKPHH